MKQKLNDLIERWVAELNDTKVEGENWDWTFGFIDCLEEKIKELREVVDGK